MTPQFDGRRPSKPSDQHIAALYTADECARAVRGRTVLQRRKPADYVNGRFG